MKPKEVKKIMEDAENAYSSAEYDMAIQLYKQALLEDSKNKQIQQQIKKTEELKRIIDDADIAYYTAEYNKAIQLYERVLISDANNKHAQEQIRKAERSRPSKSNKPDDLPGKALQLYRRARSFIAMKDLTEAKKLLVQAIDIAEEAGVDFSNAQILIGNIQNALKAEEFKTKAFVAIDTKLWLKADAELNSAIELDPTDEVTQTLLLHLRGLLKAQRLMSRLEADIETARKRSDIIKEIRQIIELTNETTTLSTLWQDVVRLFGEYNNKNAVFRNRGVVFRWIMIAFLFTSTMLLITFGSLYLSPRHRSVDVACESIAPDLRAELDYPYYVANGDKEKIEITFINDGISVVDDRLVQIKFKGTGNLKYVDTSTSNEIKLEELSPDKEQPETIPFFVDGSNSIMPGPWYISFSIGACTPKDFYIAMTPINGLRNFVKLLWSTVGLALIGLFNDHIKEFLGWVLSFFKKGTG